MARTADLYILDPVTGLDQGIHIYLYRFVPDQGIICAAGQVLGNLSFPGIRNVV